MKTNVCRTCLSSNSVNMYLLFENTDYNMNLGEMLFNCCAIQTNDNSTFKCICVSCKDQLLSYYKFKKQCEQSEAMLATSLKYNISPAFLKGPINDVPKDAVESEALVATCVVYNISPVFLGPNNENNVPEHVKIKEEIESSQSVDNIDAVESDPLEVPVLDIIKETTENITKRTSRHSGDYIDAVESDPLEVPDLDITKEKLIIKEEIQNSHSDSDAVESEALLSTNVENNISPVFIKEHNYISEDEEEIKSRHSDHNIDAVELDSLEVPDLDIAKETTGEITKCSKSKKVETTKKTTKYTKKKEAQRQNNAINRPIYECSICSEKFQMIKYLQQHVSIHDSATPFKCKECGKCFPKYQNLYAHKKLHTGKKPHVCTICGKRFALPSYLKSHIEIHSGDKPYSCQECGKSFTKRSTLKNHSFFHSGGRSYVCAICGKTLTTNGGLARHMSSHTDERKYSCNICNKRFKTALQRGRHVLTHSAEKKYKCTFCEKSFNRSGNLNTHLKIHTGVRPYGCPVCEKRFIYKHCFTAHMNTHC